MTEPVLCCSANEGTHIQLVQERPLYDEEIGVFRWFRRTLEPIPLYLFYWHGILSIATALSRATTILPWIRTIHNHYDIVLSIATVFSFDTIFCLLPRHSLRPRHSLHEYIYLPTSFYRYSVILFLICLYLSYNFR